MRKFVALIITLLLLAFGTTAEAAEKDDDLLDVVTTASPLFDAAGDIGGDRIHASNPLQLDPLATPSAEAAEEMRDADLVVALGGNAQPQLEAILRERSGPTIRVVDEFVPHPDFAPNVWLDPNNMAVIGELIEARLVELEPDGEEDFEENQSDFVQSVADVDRIYERTLATCERREFLTTTPEYDYLADRYALTQIDVRGRPLAAVADTMDVTTVMSTSLPTLDEAERILDESGLRSAALDPMAARTDQARRGGASWVGLTSLNLDVLREALDCDEVSLGDD